MKRFAVPFCLLLATPVLAEETDNGPSLMERGAQMFLEGLMQEVEPRLDDLQDLADQFGPAMRGFFEEMGPALGELMSRVEDWSSYHPPEMLPNGDIIIRRKTEKERAEEEEQNDPIDL